MGWSRREGSHSVYCGVTASRHRFPPSLKRRRLPLIRLDSFCCLERNIAPSFPRNLFACQYVSTLLTQWPGHQVNCCQTLSASWQILLSCLSWARSIFFVSSCYIPSKFSSTKLVTVIFKVSPPHPPPPLSQSRLINRVISELIIVMLFWTLWNTSHSRLCWSSFQC